MWYGNHKTTSSAGAADTSYRAQLFIPQLFSRLSPAIVAPGIVLAQ